MSAIYFSNWAAAILLRSRGSYAYIPLDCYQEATVVILQRWFAHTHLPTSACYANRTDFAEPCSDQSSA